MSDLSNRPTELDPSYRSVRPGLLRYHDEDRARTALHQEQSRVSMSIFDSCVELLNRAHRLTIHRGDHVALLQAGFGCRGTRIDVRYHDSLRGRRQLQLAAKLRIQHLD